MIKTEHIIKLLQQHSCVIIPNFGTFITNQESSKISIIDANICPPHLLISFDSNVIKNDNLLVNYFSESEKITTNNASSLIQQQVSIWNTKLHNGENIKLDNLGILSLDIDKNIQFKSVGLFLNSSAFFGLQNIHLKPILRVEEKESIIKELVRSDDKGLHVEGFANDFTKQKSNASRNWWIAAAAIIILCISVISGMICMDDKYCAMNLSNFISFNWANDFIEFVQKLFK
jgi:nucleoid DNA-binding protein